VSVVHRPTLLPCVSLTIGDEALAPANKILDLDFSLIVMKSLCCGVYSQHTIGLT
jgi:hypothetical protein